MLIEYKNTTIYQEETCVLKNIDFHVEEGEFVYLIGRVGSGKSSLLKTMYGEVPIVECDRAEVLGYPIKGLKRKKLQELRRQLGIVFQDFRLLGDRTVYENLRFVLRATGWKKKDIPARITEVLTQVGMADKGQKMPNELSGGEQQRIVIARAILNHPKLILADEPTGNLDIETSKKIVELLRSLCDMGTGVVMSTHNLALINSYPGVVYRCKDQAMDEITEEFNHRLTMDEQNLLLLAENAQPQLSRSVQEEDLEEEEEEEDNE